MKIYIAALVAAFAVVALPLEARAQDDSGTGFAWKCTPTGRNAMQCQIKNTGTVPAGMCVEVVKVCKSGDHAAYVCTDRMNPGEVEARVGDDFGPKVKFLESCYGVEYRKKHIDK